MPAEIPHPLRSFRERKQRKQDDAARAAFGPPKLDFRNLSLEKDVAAALDGPPTIGGEPARPIRSSTEQVVQPLDPTAPRQSSRRLYAPATNLDSTGSGASTGRSPLLVGTGGQYGRVRGAADFPDPYDLEKRSPAVAQFLAQEPKLETPTDETRAPSILEWFRARRAKVFPSVPDSPDMPDDEAFERSVRVYESQNFGDTGSSDSDQATANMNVEMSNPKLHQYWLKRHRDQFGIRQKEHKVLWFRNEWEIPDTTAIHKAILDSKPVLKAHKYPEYRNYRPRLERNTARHTSHGGHVPESSHTQVSMRTAYLNDETVRQSFEKEWFSQEQAEQMYDAISGYMSEPPQPVEPGSIDAQIMNDLSQFLRSIMHEDQSLEPGQLEYFVAFLQRNYADLYRERLAGVGHENDRETFFKVFIRAQQGVVHEIQSKMAAAQPSS